ncbi:MAG: hypothetical protein QM523_00890 [Candidatus Pacebacteria bacterium]|nr:hypothetical protein [Candidatus Paceibacterota bacterium]
MLVCWWRAKGHIQDDPGSLLHPTVVPYDGPAGSRNRIWPINAPALISGNGSQQKLHRNALCRPA